VKACSDNMIFPLCHSRESGNPLSGITMTCGLDSRFRGNDKVDFQTKSIPFMLVISLILAFSIIENAKADSAFSALGYGLLQNASSSRSAGMGMVSLALPDLLCLDLHAPALWEGSATTRFGLQGGITRTYAKDSYGNDLSDLAGVVGVAMTVPIGYDAFFGVAISPYTKMGYLWESERVAAEDWNPTIERRQGRGGLSQAIVGFSLPYKDKLRIGIAGRAIFGKSDQKWELEFPGVESKAASKTVSDRYKGIGATLSGRWLSPSGWSVGYAVNSPVAVEIQQQLLIKAGSATQVDTTKTLDDKYDLPWDAALGVSKLYNRHIFSVEAAWHGWGSVDNPDILTHRFTDAYRFSAGWEWSPEYRPFDPVWQALTYRGGMYMQEHYARSAGGNQSRRFAGTIGLGIPYYKGRSRVDIALEFGLMGSQNNDGVAERFGVLTVGFNHSELWFVGRGERR